MYKKTAQDAIDITINLNEQAALLDQKYHSYVVNLPTLYTSMNEEPLTKIDSDFILLKDALENLVNDFWGPFIKIQIPS